MATVNKADSKMLSATFKDGELQRVYYYEAPKNDGYPLVQLSREEMYLKGFKWQGDRRPADRNAVTPLSLRPSQRLKYASRPRAKFVQTDKYFPGYMNDIYRQIHVRDSLRLIRQREEERAKQLEAIRQSNDTLQNADTLVVDSLMNTDLSKTIESVPTLDSLKVDKDTTAVVDSVAISTLGVSDELVVLDKKSEKQLKKEKREAEKKKRREAREARWAEKDRLYEEKMKAKKEKVLEKARQKKRKALEAAAKQAEKDAAVLEKYMKKYQEQLQKKASAKDSLKGENLKKALR